LKTTALQENNFLAVLVAAYGKSKISKLNGLFLFKLKNSPLRKAFEIFRSPNGV
jgi:hypothetical protein